MRLTDPRDERSRTAWLRIFSLLFAITNFLGIPLQAFPPDPLPNGANAITSAADPETRPKLEAARAEAARTVAGLRLPTGFQAHVFAVEPLLGNPVAFTLDERNRVYVAESYRFNRGTEENRTRSFFLTDDLSLKTLDDRRAMYQKFADKFSGGMEYFTRYADQVRRVVDKDGDGQADESTIFAGGFNETLDGLAAGVLVRDRDVYFTCIPNLWLLRDENQDGIAETRRPLLTGFGVNAAFLGHDLHGLTFGPDGRLYFSVGDRGFDVTTPAGRFSGPRTGAVFRCRPDGSQFEVVHRGLRNPQELAWDDHGNLFAADNNCDKGDKSRLVWIVDGGDSGWNMAFQTIPEPYLTGPWHAEKMWHLATPEQPAWLVPPVGHLGAGPSGFTSAPGTGLPDRFKKSFFMCNFKGNQGGIESFNLRPEGASFSVQDYEPFLTPLMATDAEFGYDGKLYVSDWVQFLWEGGGAGKGRIYTLHVPELQTSPEVQQVQQRFATGFAQVPAAELASWLGHADRRLRLRAQFALVEKGTPSIAIFAKVLRESQNPLARLHALWGLGQLGESELPVQDFVLPCLSADDPELRAQAAAVVGRWHLRAAEGPLRKLLRDPEPRVKFFAALALGQLPAPAARADLMEMLRENDDRDTYLRHAGVRALERLGPSDELRAFSTDSSPAVRLAVLLAWRRFHDAQLQRFLADTEPRLAAEAARAIIDLPLEKAYPELSRLSSTIMKTPELFPDFVIRRVIDAQFRLGTPEQAVALARLAAVPQLSPALRTEALLALADWLRPSPRDRVTGIWQPLENRDAGPVRAALAPLTPTLLASAHGALLPAALDVVAKLELPADESTFFHWVSDPQQSSEARTAALRLLAARNSPQLKEAIQLGLNATSTDVRAEARRTLARIQPEQGLPLLAQTLASSQAELREQQAALAALAELATPAADAHLKPWVEKLGTKDLPVAWELDVLNAGLARQMPVAQQRNTVWDDARRAKTWEQLGFLLAGGDATRGRDVFVSHRAAQCLRCHKIKSEGGDVGPDLTEIAKRGDRLFLLQSLLDPNLKIAQGFASATLVLTDGRQLTGIVKAEDSKQVTLVMPDGRIVSVPTTEIDERAPALSAMPLIGGQLNFSETRDLIEYLSQLK